MQYDQQAAPGGKGSVLRPLPANNIDTGLGLNRMAAILQGKQSVFETDQFQPLIELGEELSGARYGHERDSDRAMRILADHGRAMTFLIADGVVPSNEDRGYVLRRVMRRAIQQGRALELAPGFLLDYAARVRELMGGAYPELGEQAESIEMWLAAEEESFGRTLAQGMGVLRGHVERARAAGVAAVAAADVFRLHDTFGFPAEMTAELLAEEGIAIEGDFERLMDEQRARGRAGTRGASAGGESAKARAEAGAFAAESGFATRFTGYESEQQHTTVGALRALADGAQLADSDDVPANGATAAAGGRRYLVKLEESPFYAPGGGQVADAGTIECADGDCRARVEEIFRIGEDQALSVVLERGTLHEGEPVLASVDRRARHATECNHTATHLLQAALREIARQPRAPGRLLRRPRQAALRLQPRPGPQRTRDRARSRTASTTGSRATTPSSRSPRRSTRRAVSARWRCSVRSTARSCAWWRSAAASTRASCAAAPTFAPPPRSAPSGSSLRPRARPT